MSLTESLENFEGRVHQAELFSDILWMAELIDEGYTLMADVDRELPGEGLKYRDQVASLIDKLCDAISESEE